LVLQICTKYIDDEHYNSGHGHAYEKYGVKPDVGAVVIVRPDQCEFNPSLREFRMLTYADVSKVTTLDDHEGIHAFFSGCLITQNIKTNGVLA